MCLPAVTVAVSLHTDIYIFLFSFAFLSSLCVCNGSQQEQETSYTILRSKGTNVTLNGLKPDTTYLLQIRARTAAGYGSSSRKFEFETSPDCEHSLPPLITCLSLLTSQRHLWQ